MRYSIILIVKKITAWFMSIFMALGIVGGTNTEEPDIQRGEENSITAYDKAQADYSLSIDAANRIHAISELLYGIFFEDINFAADGGVYAEKVVNRSFEYGELASDDELHGWSQVGTVDYSVAVGDAENGLNANNTNYLVINNTSGALGGVQNKGFLEGMAIEKDVAYDFSVYAKALDG